jgi:hypothetical protein
MSPKIIPNWVYLVLILVAGFSLRMYRFNNPVADWHSFRQADTASVAKEFVKNGVSLLEPRYHDLSNIQSGMDNPEGFRMVEFPFISVFVALSYKPLEGLIDLHVWYRLVTIVFSLGSIALIYELGRFLDSTLSGLISAAVFATLPFSVYYGRAILPETPMIFFSLASTLAALYFCQSKRLVWLVVSVLGSAAALLLKPVAIFLIAPVGIYILWQPKTRNVSLAWIGGIIISTIPLFLWRSWISRYPQGIPAYSWLLNGNNIRFRPAFFRWIFLERLGKLILGYGGGVPLMVLGYLSRTAKSTTPSHNYYLKKLITGIKSASPIQVYLGSLTCSLLAYLVIFATGNVQHDYYQVMLLPLISLLVSRGILFLYVKKTRLSFVLLSLFILWSWVFSWYQVKGYFNVNNWAIVKAGRRVDALVPGDALVIAPYMGDTAFLYQTNRRGWPLGFNIDEKISQGATYYVSTSYDDEARMLESQYTLLEKNPEYIIIALH